MEKWGYVRVSVNRVEQAAGWDDQIATLKGLGCSLIFFEEASTRGERPEFRRMLAEANEHAKGGKRVCLNCSQDGPRIS